VAARQRILVMPAGSFQVPAIRTAHSMGLEVVAIDRRPAAPGLALADIAEAVDPTDLDKAIDVGKRHAVSAVVSIANDPCVVPCAVVANALGLPGLPYETALRTRNKVLARKRLAAALPQYCPKFCALSSVSGLARAVDQVGLPLVLKPQEGNGSKGVIRVEAAAMLEKAFQYAQSFSKDGVLVAEERLAGREVSLEGITFGGETELVAITDKMTCPPPFCAEIGHTIPADLPGDAADALETAFREIIAAFGIESGASHCELFATKDGVRLVELGARLAGGCIASHLAPLATGIDLVRAAIDLALGKRPDLERTRSRAAAIRFLDARPGRVRSVTGIDDARAAPGVVDAVVNVGPGDIVFPLQHSDHRVGYVIADGADRGEAARNLEHAVGLIAIEC